MKKLKLGLEWFLNPDHVPFLIGQEMGWFAEAGIELELVEPAEHLDAFAAIETGELDLAITEPLHLVEDRAAGRHAIGFCRFLHTNGGVMVLESSGITRPRELSGKRIQYPGAPGPGGPAIVSAMIEADGGTPKDLTPVNHGFAHTDALVEGKADCATLAFYNFEVVEARHRGHPARFFALKDWGVPDFCQLILTGHADRVERDAETLRALLRVMMRGLDLLHQDPAEARRIYFARTGTPDDDPLMSAIFDATVPCFTFDFAMSDAYYRQLARWMRTRALVEAEVSPHAIWTNRLTAG